MKFNEINKRYTELVSEYLNKGYHINAGTMAGSQGEHAHIDLSNGEELIRIVVGDFIEGSYSRYRGIEILVGRCTDKYVRKDVENSRGSVWNDKLEVIISEKFYRIGEARDGEKWYGTKKEAEVQNEKMMSRYRNRCGDEDDRRTLPEKAAAIVLPYVKKQPKCRSIKTSDISVYKKDTNYYISAKGHHFQLA